MTGSKSSDDLAFEAMELIRKKNVKFWVQTHGQQWECTMVSKAEYEKQKSEAASPPSSSSGVPSMSVKASPASSMKSGRSDQ